ncbi:hypothetical protein C1H46_028459 [Malus baccata]|uniref:Uncharacterized protein n=1 Tax=Malus baccata TaxID=106549 RepID=A0A540LHR2_MALBA|nr:hypothetical protein C1H46_028459 [Malus baccata]
MDTKGKECLHVGFCDLGLNKSASVLPGSSTPKLRMKGSIAVYHVHMIREGAIPSEELHLQKSSWVVNCDWKCLIHVVAFEFRSNARAFLLVTSICIIPANKNIFYLINCKKNMLIFKYRNYFWNMLGLMNASVRSRRRNPAKFALWKV